MRIGAGIQGSFYQNIGSSELALRDMEEPNKAAVSFIVFKEDEQELGCYRSSWEHTGQVRACMPLLEPQYSDNAVFSMCVTLVNKSQAPMSFVCS